VNAFPTYLWKEWREQRATLGLLALALAVGVGVVVSTLPRTAAGDPLTFQCVQALALAATVFSVGADLLARERERGLRFLERQPAGLAAAFRAKLAFLVLAMGAALVFGALLALAAARLRTGAWPELPLDLEFAQWIGVLLVLPLWTFAVSAWMPTSALTLPASALLLAAFAWPAIPVILRYPLYRPTDAQVWIFAALCVLGAPASAWAAFVVGSRAGRTRRTAACAGLAVAALAFAPSWCWAGMRYLAARNAARNAPLEFRVAWVGTNGRYAFVNVQRSTLTGEDEDNPWSALVVDLADGSWRFAGARDASGFTMMRGVHRDGSVPESPCASPLILFNRTVEPWIEEQVDPLSAERLSAALPATPPRVTPASFGLAQDPPSWFVRAAGLGWRMQYRDGNRDRFRYLDAEGRVLTDEDLPRDEHGRTATLVLIRPGRWLMHGARGWRIFDPHSDVDEPWKHETRGEHLGAILDDGRAILVSGKRAHLIDVESGARHELRDPEGAPVETNRFHPATYAAWFAMPSDRASLVVIGDFDKTSRLAWLDPRCGTLIPGPMVMHGPMCDVPLLRVLWSDGPRAIVLEETRRIAFHDLERNERRVILEAADVR
jgi:hypothetical protein